MIHLYWWSVLQLSNLNSLTYSEIRAFSGITSLGPCRWSCLTSYVYTCHHQKRAKWRAHAVELNVQPGWVCHPIVICAFSWWHQKLWVWQAFSTSNTLERSVCRKVESVISNTKLASQAADQDVKGWGDAWLGDELTLLQRNFHGVAFFFSL